MHDRRVAVAGSARNPGAPSMLRLTRPMGPVPTVVATGYGFALALVGVVLFRYADGAESWESAGTVLVALGSVLVVLALLLGQRPAARPRPRPVPLAPPEIRPEQLDLPPMPAAGVDILAAGITADLGELLRRDASTTAPEAAAVIAADLGELLRRVALIARQCPPEERSEVAAPAPARVPLQRDTAKALVLTLCSLVLLLGALLSSARNRSGG